MVIAAMPQWHGTVVPYTIGIGLVIRTGEIL